MWMQVTLCLKSVSLDLLRFWFYADNGFLLSLRCCLNILLVHDICASFYLFSGNHHSNVSRWGFAQRLRDTLWNASNGSSKFFLVWCLKQAVTRRKIIYPLKLKRENKHGVTLLGCAAYLSFQTWNLATLSLNWVSAGLQGKHYLPQQT